LKVFKPRDVQDGATIQVFGDAFRVQVDSDFDVISRYERRVMVANIVSLAIRHAKTKWFEWLRVHAFLEVAGGKHIPVKLTFIGGLSMFFAAPPSMKSLFP
jgi:hypothetical protein